MQSNRIANIYKRLGAAGFKKEFIRKVILPDWWSNECDSDPLLSNEFEFRIARFLKKSISTIRNVNMSLTPAAFAGAKLRKIHNIDADRLAPAIYAGIQIAEAVVRNLNPGFENHRLPDSNPLRLKQSIHQSDKIVRLEDLLRYLRTEGIPVIPSTHLPSPSFQGMACIINGIPVIVLGHKIDIPHRAAFILAHEIGHLAAGDAKEGCPVVDEDEDIADDSQEEVEADNYANLILNGSNDIPKISGANPKEIAAKAWEIEAQGLVSADSIIFEWAKRNNDFAIATNALKALYRASGARRILANAFLETINIDEASETDKSMLLSIKETNEPTPI